MFNNISRFNNAVSYQLASFSKRIDNCIASTARLPIIDKVCNVANNVFKKIKSYQPQSNSKNIKSFAMFGVLFMIFIIFKSIFSKTKPTASSTPPSTPNNSEPSTPNNSAQNTPRNSVPPTPFTSTTNLLGNPSNS